MPLNLPDRESILGQTQNPTTAATPEPITGGKWDARLEALQLRRDPDSLAAATPLPQLGVAAPPPPPSVNMRATDDPDALRQAVYAAVEAAAAKMEPVAGPTHTLSLRDVHYAHDDPDFDKAAEKRAIMERSSLNRRLRGTWQLFDNATGGLVAERKATVANVPAILHDGTFLHKGTRYAMGYQQRLRPGMYVRKKGDGALETHANIRPGHGRSHRYILQPETGHFFINIEHANVPLVPLLETLGATREQMEDAWGKELTAKNITKVDGKAIGKLYDRLVPKKLREDGDRSDPQKMRQKIRDAFDDMEVDDEVVARTMGRKHGKIDADMILRATKASLALARGEREPDDRDHLAYATFHSAPDIFAERFTKDYGRLRKTLLQKAARKGNLDSFPASALDKQIDAAIFKSGLALTVEDVNPAEILAAMTRVTRFGEGGLPGTQSVPKESRNVGVGQFGFIDPIATPESLKVGVDGFLSKNTFIGDDNKLYTRMLDKKGQEVTLSAHDIIDKTFSVGPSSLPGRELAVRGGKLSLVKTSEVDFRIPDFEQMFGHGGGLTPLKSAMFGQRASMATRMAQQSLAVDDAEAPLLQTGVPGTDYDSFEARIGERFGALRAKQPGRVLSVTPDHIEVIYAGGEKAKLAIDNNRPGARKSVYHQDPLVQPGDEFAPGQMLAKSNYVDKDGVAALGLNVRAALMAWGDDWEDGIVVSQSMADRMRVQQAYKHNLETGDGDEVSKRGFLSRFGSTYSSDQLNNINAEGVINVGTKVKKGDPLILAVRERNGVKSRVHKQGKSNWGDSSVIWDHAHDGIVTDVLKTKKGAQVVVRTSQGLQPGSKISGRQGNKGVVAIVPDAEMPHDQDGRPIEMAISPLSVPSRGNSSFPLELLLAKVARKRGKPFRINDYDGRDMRQFAEDQAKQHGVEATETLIDPRTGRKIPNILTGELFTMALSHTAESKASARGLGSYNAEGLPARGAQDGAQSKRVSGQELYAHLAHGAYDFSREASTLRGQRNDDYWAAFMSGGQIREPQVPAQYEGYMQRLRAAGIHPVRKGQKTQLMAMTDKDVANLAGNRRVTVADTVNMHKDLAPIKGGLMDPSLFGDGSRFAAYDLPEPLPNPVFEEPIRRMLGLTEKQYRGVLGGTEELPGYGTGSAAIGARLQAMDLDGELERARREVAGTKKVARDAAVRRLRYLKGLQRTGTKPADLMVSAVPVLPPKFRPITAMSGKGGVSVEDSNFLYTELMRAGENLASLKKNVDDVGDERLALYDAHKALIGLSDPQSHELKQRKVQGLLKTVLGKSSPKGSMMQRKLLSGNVDTVSRGVINVDSELYVDEAGLPENMAFEIYQPYIVRNLVQNGVPRLQAMEWSKDRHPRAREALLKEMDRRPITITRAPVLHRGGVQGFKPKLIKGDAIRLPPMSYAGLAADNDGDAVNVNVPHGPRAVAEVYDKMLPSRMLISEADFKSPKLIPSQDHLLGLHQASRAPKKGARTRYFDSWEDAKRAFQTGQLDIDEPVKILGKGQLK